MVFGLVLRFWGSNIFFRFRAFRGLWLLGAFGGFGICSSG